MLLRVLGRGCGFLVFLIKKPHFAMRSHKMAFATGVDGFNGPRFTGEQLKTSLKCLRWVNNIKILLNRKYSSALLSFICTSKPENSHGLPWPPFCCYDLQFGTSCCCFFYVLQLKMVDDAAGIRHSYCCYSSSCCCCCC